MPVHSVFHSFPSEWEKFLNEFDEIQWSKLKKTVQTNYEQLDFTKKIYPECNDRFNFLHLTAPHEVKVIILGQDPYINPGEAHGLCFSVPEGHKVPPSLKNIFKELNECYAFSQRSTDLSDWAKQGVLLMNTTWTVYQGASNSHKNLGWIDISIFILRALNKNFNPICVAWGTFAQQVYKKVSPEKLLISEHPSPMSVNRGGFLGNKHFIKINELLKEDNKNPIKWV